MIKREEEEEEEEEEDDEDEDEDEDEEQKDKEEYLHNITDELHTNSGICIQEYPQKY